VQPAFSFRPRHKLRVALFVRLKQPPAHADLFAEINLRRQLGGRNDARAEG